MSRPTRTDSGRIRRTERAAYQDWKEAASDELQLKHAIPPSTIPERVWMSLYARRFNSEAAAARAEFYYRRLRPAGELWRKEKELKEVSNGASDPRA